MYRGGISGGKLARRPPCCLILRSLGSAPHARLDLRTDCTQMSQATSNSDNPRASDAPGQQQSAWGSVLPPQPQPRTEIKQKVDSYSSRSCVTARLGFCPPPRNYPRHFSKQQRIRRHRAFASFFPVFRFIGALRLSELALDTSAFDLRIPEISMDRGTQ